MNAGDTFFLWIKAAEKHLWVVVSDPDAFPGAVLIANLTTHTCDQEDVCLLDAGEHPYIRHKTCVAYGRAKRTTRDDLCRLRDAGKIDMQGPVSPEVLQRILIGASLSRRIPRDLIELMGDQDLLD
jgi:hypothetical protein